MESVGKINQLFSSNITLQIPVVLSWVKAFTAICAGAYSEQPLTCKHPGWMLSAAE